MSKRIHALAQRLFGKATIEECEVEEVKSLVQRFPYFAPAQFLLLEKLKQEGSEDYPTQLQKSILYYHNPLEFQYFVSPQRFYTEVSFEKENEVLPEVEIEISEEGQEPGDLSQETGGEQANVSGEIFPDEHEEEISNTESEEIPVDIQETAIIDEQTPINNYQDSNLDEVVAVAEVLPSGNSEQAPDLPEIKELQLQTPNPTIETELTFEPFHTVDYFASQGIKLSQEELPKDKLGKQLKSFTEWLKTMKRLSPTQMAGTTDANTENKVQHMADDSVHDSNVWTEAMAEVWSKQGNTQKAIEVLTKLSLLNPSKKAYFATKIENLKRS